MKGSERHRLKENELSHVLERRHRASAGERGTFGLAAGIVALVLVAGVGYWAWTTRSENRAQALLGDAIVDHAGAGGGAEAGRQAAAPRLPDGAGPRGSRAGEVHRGL